jgi:hypothetical protein
MAKKAEWEMDIYLCWAVMGAPLGSYVVPHRGGDRGGLEDS